MHPTSKMPRDLIIAAILFMSYAPEYNGALSLDLQSRRSLIVDPRIINGVNAKIEEVPYQVSLEFEKKHNCGGAIINGVMVFTAAHCIYPYKSQMKFMRIRVGSTRNLPIIGWDGTVHEILTWASHNKFNYETADYDVAVIRVPKPFKFSSKVRPISIPTETENEFIDYKQTALVSGYGSTKDGATQPSRRLQSAVIPLIPREQCAAGIPDGLSIIITPRMICGAATGIEGTDVNNGDSGGPVVHKGKLIGVVSLAMRFHKKELPSVYTSVLNEEIKDFLKYSF